MPLNHAVFLSHAYPIRHPETLPEYEYGAHFFRRKIQKPEPGQMAVVLCHVLEKRVKIYIPENN
jgi:hypothetical protein